MSENPMMKRAQCAMVEAGATLWRNNVGLFYQGKAKTIKEGGMAKVNAGDVILSRPRRIKCGLDNGSGDLIGFTPVKITPEMVGKTIAVFTSAEAKDLDGASTPEQRAWMMMVLSNAGIGITFHDEAEACMMIQDRVKDLQG